MAVYGTCETCGGETVDYGCLQCEYEAKEKLESQLAGLLAVIHEVHSQHADDLCWMPADVNKIFAAAGLPPQDLRVGDKAAMRKNCDRYIDCLGSGGPWKSYADLEAENVRLKNYIRSVLKLFAYRDAGKFDSDEADKLREEMVAPWYALSDEERKLMDRLVMELDAVRTGNK